MVPLVPRSGARKSDAAAFSPALSMRSPSRTKSPLIVTSPFSEGITDFCAAALPARRASAASAAGSERVVRMIRFSSAHHVGGLLQHVVRRRHDLGVHGVSALRRDQVGHFGDGADVRLLQLALQQVAHAIHAWITDLWRTARGGLEK